VIAQGDDIVLIPHQTSVSRRQSWRSQHPLTPEELAQIDHLFPPGAAQGERYAESMMALLNR
jgi:hypothetical protein